MMVPSRHWWVNFDNYFVNFAYLVRDYCFSRYYHSVLVLKFTSDLFNYYVLYFLIAITDDGLTSL